MRTVSLFDAKTHLSRIVDDLLSGKEDRVVITRRGMPSVLVVPANAPDVSRRIGLASGRFEIPDDIDGANPEIANLCGIGRHSGTCCRHGDITLAP